jgi:trimeric autotransporter adhesin
MIWTPRRNIVKPPRLQGGFLLNPFRFGGGGGDADYPSAVLADSPVAYWRLGESSTSDAMADEMGVHNGTYSGGTLGVTGAITGDSDTAYTPGASGYGSSAHASALGLSFPFSIEFLFKHTLTTNVILVEKNGNAGISVQRSGSNLLIMNLGGTGSGNRVSTNSGWNNGDWHHCVFVADPSGGGNKVYIDAIDDTGDDNNAAINTSVGSWLIGSRSGTFGYEGTLDEVALYNYALSPARIAAHYALV